jgi:hypothetical protein
MYLDISFESVVLAHPESAPIKIKLSIRIKPCSLCLTLIIEQVVYVTSRFDFYFRHFQCLPFDFIKYFSLSCHPNRKALQKQKEPDFKATFYASY